MERSEYSFKVIILKTVYFLNQVDEVDLMSLMEKEDVDKLQAELEKGKQPAPIEPLEEKVEVIEKT